MMMQARLALPVALLGALASTSIQGQLWGDVRLPGNVSAARRIVELDSSPARIEAAGLIDLARLAAGNSSNAKTATLLDRYLTTMDAMQTQRRALPNGLILPSSSTAKKDREAIQDVLELLGLRLRESRGVYAAEIGTSADAVERAAWLAANGVNIKHISDTATATSPAPFDLNDTDLPLPLPEFWRQEIFDRKHLPIAQIVADRRSSLLYVGLMALDDETLTFLAARPDLVRHLREDHPGAFATFARSIRIRDGMVDVPGGDAAAASWEALVGRNPTDAERFIRDLLGQDEGRLAYFYDVVDHLDARRQAFVLGGQLAVVARPRFVKHVYDQFPSTAQWTIEDRPFFRPTVDGGLVLAFTDVDEDGTAGPSMLPSLLQQAVGGGDWPTRADRVRSDVKDRPADAVWVLQWIFDSPRDAAARFRLFRFAQRLLQSTRAGRDDLLGIELALRTWYEMPALGQTLERLGVTDLSVWGSVGVAARRLTLSGGIGDVGPVLGRWQATLGVLEQSNRLRPIKGETVAGLLKSLAESTPKSQGEAPGVLPRWIVEQLVPAFVQAPLTSADPEQTIVGALAGGPAPNASKFSWEGLDYVVDMSGAVQRQVGAIRQLQRTPKLQDLVAMQHVRRAIEHGVPSLADLKSLVSEMTRLQAAMALLPVVDGKKPSIVNDYRSAVSKLAKIKKTQDLTRVSKAAPEVDRALDALCDAIVKPLLYAFAATPTDQPSQIVATAWQSHSFLPASAADQRPWATIAWQTADVDPGAQSGLLLRGSYLNLDIPLSATRIPQLPKDATSADRVTGEDHAAVVQALNLGPLGGSTSVTPGQAVEALLQGRALVKRWADVPPDRASLRSSLRRAGVDEWRTNVMLWTAERAPAQAFGALRTTELFSLGGGTSLPAELGWPASMIDGCLCRLAAGGRTPEDVRGRGGVQAAAINVDLLLRLGEALAALKVPPNLASLLLPQMTADWMNHVQQINSYDWEALATWPNHAPPAKVESALLHLVTTGVLSSPQGGHQDAVR